MQRIGDATAELMQRLRMAYTGADSFDAAVSATPEEKAVRDAAALNEEIGREHEIDGYVCEACRNRGYTYIANGAYVTRRDCDCLTARRTIRRMQRSGLGNVITKYTFALYDDAEDWQKTVKATAKAFLKDEAAKWFFIGGSSGGGKSHICTAICRSLLATKEVYYMLWESESRELKTMITTPEEYDKRINYIKNVDVLYIDDFFRNQDLSGRQNQPTQGDINLAREIFNHRYINGKTTIISSEWYSTEIIDMSAAIGGRIVESAGSYCLNIERKPEKNYRLKLGGVIL